MDLLFLNVGAAELMMLVPILLVGIFYIYCIVHCLSNNKLKGNSKLLWLIIVLIAPFIGSLIYILVGRKGQLSESA